MAAGGTIADTEGGLLARVAIAVEILPAAPTSDTLDPYAVEFVTDTDRLMTMCSCSSSSDVPYQ
jgi:hypothetical protein